MTSEPTWKVPLPLMADFALPASAAGALLDFAGFEAAVSAPLSLAVSVPPHALSVTRATAAPRPVRALLRVVLVFQLVRVVRDMCDS